MKTKNVLRFSTEDFNAIQQHLAKVGEDESFIYGLFSKAKGRECTIYICSKLLIPDQQQLQEQSCVSIAPSREYQAVTYGLAYELGLSVVDIHTHPFTQNARFSGIDMHHGTANATYIAEHFPDCSTMGMLVLGKGFDNFQAQIWNKRTKRFDLIHRVEILGTPTSILIDDLSPQHQDSDIYARHQIIPGWKQGLLEDLKVFVCGLGGNGALIFDSLLSLGVGKNSGWIKACDPDIIEESNLPRIPYAYPEEVGRPKAEIAQIHADNRTPDLNVHCYQIDVKNKEIQDILKEANVIFGTVDNDGARMFLNSHAARYVIPYIDLGTEIIPQKSTYEAVGQVQIYIPGKIGCLTCSGSIDPSEAALDSMTQEDRTEYKRAGYVRGTNETPTPSVLHLNGVVTHLAISQFLKMVFDDGFNGKDYLQYNRQESSLIIATTVRDDDCPVCGMQGYSASGDEQKPSFEEFSNLKDKITYEQKPAIKESKLWD